jgi:hypothetical protein
MLPVRQPRTRELSAISSVGFGGAFVPVQAERIPLDMSPVLLIGLAQGYCRNNLLRMAGIQLFGGYGRSLENESNPLLQFKGALRRQCRIAFQMGLDRTTFWSDAVSEPLTGEHIETP